MDRYRGGGTSFKLRMTCVWATQHGAGAGDTLSVSVMFGVVWCVRAGYLCSCVYRAGYDEGAQATTGLTNV